MVDFTKFQKRFLHDEDWNSTHPCFGMLCHFSFLYDMPLSFLVASHSLPRVYIPALLSRIGVSSLILVKIDAWILKDTRKSRLHIHHRSTSGRDIQRSERCKEIRFAIVRAETCGEKWNPLHIFSWSLSPHRGRCNSRVVQGCVQNTSTHNMTYDTAWLMVQTLVMIHKPYNMAWNPPPGISCSFRIVWDCAPLKGITNDSLSSSLWCFCWSHHESPGALWRLAIFKVLGKILLTSALHPTTIARRQKTIQNYPRPPLSGPIIVGQAGRYSGWRRFCSNLKALCISRRAWKVTWACFVEI